MNKSKKIVWTETDRKLQVKSKCEVNGPRSERNVVEGVNRPG
jgi:hypothetical protein